MKRKVFRIISWGGIGDAILTTPSFRALKERHPGSKIILYCGAKSHWSVFVNNPYIDSLRLAKLTSAPLQFIKFHLNKGRFYMPQYGMFNLSFHNIGKAVDVVAEMFFVKLNDKRLQIYLTEEEAAWAQHYLKDYPNPVAMHASPYCSANKSWPLDRWAELIKRNPEYTFLQLGVAADVPVPGAVDLRGWTSLRQSFALIKYARGFIGVDSGFGHAAAAFGTPGVVLFGPSNPGPWGHATNINLYAGLACSPCIDILKGDACPYGLPCMNSLSLHDVSEALRRQMSYAALRAS